MPSRQLTKTKPKPEATKPEAPRVAFRPPAEKATEPETKPVVDAQPVATSTDVAEALEPVTKPKLEAARFHGIVPGASTRDELIESWGQPEQTKPAGEGELLAYDLAPFAGVQALVEDDLVTLIRVQLEAQQEPERLARRLRLDKIAPVEILNEAEASVAGIAYPEKGIVLMLAEPSVIAPPEAPQFVTHMVIQKLDAEAFALRADQAPYEAFEKKLGDLQTALEINPNDAYTNWQLAQLHRLTASPAKAEPAAAAALKAEPNSEAYRLCHAQCLADLGKFDEAVLAARKVLDSKDAPNVVKAGALHLMGRLASQGDSNIADKAISFHTMAIDVADKLATSSDLRERHTAKRVLVDAHLAVAREIARRKYTRKSEIVAQWVSRASGLAEEMITNDDGSLELRLIVAGESLAALADMKPAKDPAPWISEAEETATQLLADSSDKLFRSRVQWRLGEAYFHALRIEHSRKRADQGIEYGQKAIDYLQRSAVVGDIRPEAEALVGRLYFHIGAAHAVHKQDHAQAVDWYDRAYPLITSEAPTSELAVPRRKGEALVSMAVSYWTQDQRDRGVELTVAGAELMETAVAAGVLEEKALAVPYGNLATMHRKLGNRNESAKFAKLARGARGSETPSFAEAVTKPAPPKQATTPKSPTRDNRAASQPATTSNPRTAAKPQRRTATQPNQTSSAKPKVQRIETTIDEPAKEQTASRRSPRRIASSLLDAMRQRTRFGSSDTNDTSDTEEPKSSTPTKRRTNSRKHQSRTLLR